jgi:transposase
MVIDMVRDMDEWDRLLEQLDLSSGEDTWVTLAEAEAQTGVSRSALRSWYRSGQLPTRLVDGPHGPQHLVPLEVVIGRAEQSPRIRRKAAQAVGLEAELALLRHRVAEMERRLAALEDRLP